MKKNSVFFRPWGTRSLSAILLLMPLILFQSCDKNDPKPVNEEEVITTLRIVLTPIGSGIPVLMEFSDADGKHGSLPPLVTVNRSLTATTTYAATIELRNETIFPPGDISAEVEQEANDHLFCFDVTGNILIAYGDNDGNGLPLGLATSWVTGDAGSADLTLTLRHQPGTKTGQCPGTGDTDLEVSFDLMVE